MDERADAIEAWLLEHLGGALGVDPLAMDPGRPFETYGLKSADAVALQERLEKNLGREFPPTLAWEYPTPAALAVYLANEGAQAPDGHAVDPVQTRPAALESDVRAADALETEPAGNDPIAVVGIGCRFPGAAGPEAYWDLLREGRDAVRELPPERRALEALWWGEGDEALPHRFGGFLDDIERFDSDFFQISPREALAMDPQQRNLLEVAWEALEDAGVPQGQLEASRTGVFVGISAGEYAWLQVASGRPIDGYFGTGAAQAIAANRLSYQLGLRGPSLSVDTACSSSLVAVHLACESLRRGECERALAGGANLILTPAVTLALHRAGALAADGRCKSFDAAADGYVRSEGVGVVILERLSRARAEGHRVYALVRGSAVNNDGRSNGLMAPSPKAQQELLEEAYQTAEVAPASVDYVEAHGTGTPLGDPIEAQALGRVLGHGRTPEAPCRVGSVKSQLGHLEAAAGIAGLVKVALSLHHQSLPGNLHFFESNPNIDGPALGLRVQDQPEPWPGPGPRRAGVSSFGFGGTNAHAVLEEAPGEEVEPETRQAPVDGPVLFPLSARSPDALRALAATHASSAHRDGALHDLAWSAAHHRTHHDHRLAVVTDTKEGLTCALEAHASDAPRPGLTSAERCRPGRRRVAFLFTGQGSQWCGMGRDLARQPGAFRETLEECDAAIRSVAGWSVWDTLHADSDAWLSRVDRIQPALFAVQLGLARWFESHGIEPSAVVGHSLGEVGAAVSIGALDVTDGARVICARSELVRRTAGRGGIALLELSLAEAQQALAPYGPSLGIAALNAPRNVLVSGETEALDALLRELESQDVFARRVNVDYASHGPQMDPLLPELRQALEGLTPRAGRIEFLSTALGQTLAGDQLDADYWTQNLRQPVQFWPSASKLLEQDITLWLELAPHPVLTPVLRAALQEAERSDAAVVGTLRRERPETPALLSALGELYCAGHELDWQRILPRGEFVPLPTYAWRGRRFFVEATAEMARGPERAPRLTEHCYATRWRDAAPPEPREIIGEHWVLLGEREGIAIELGQALGARGARVSVVADLGALPPDEPPQVVVHLSALALGEDEGPPHHAQRETWQSALRAIQSLARAGSRNPAQLVLVTRGAQAAARSEFPVCPTQATLVGIGKVVALEHPELDCRRIDLDPAFKPDELLGELLAGDRENEVALSGGVRRVPRLERSPRLGKASAPEIRADATYLITGGLGALGLLFASRLVERGARNLVLVGRSAASPEAAGCIADLEARGATVRTERCDIGNAEAIADLFQRIASAAPPLAGVIHAAGVLEDGVLLSLEPEAFARVLSPKVSGAYYLDQLTQSAELDFFVLCSSAAAMLGSPGQANYCAANAYLDALAARRRQSGLPALSVQWGPWQGQGLAARDAKRGSRLEARGVRGLEPNAALDALEFLLARDAAVAAVIEFDLRQWLQLFPSAAEWPLLSELGIDLEPTAGATPSLRSEIEALAPDQRQATLTAHLRREIARALERDPEEIDAEIPLGELGFDSLLAVELRNRLEGLLGARLPSTLLFAHPTLSALVPALLFHLGLDESGAKTDPNGSGDDLETLLAAVEALPEEAPNAEPRAAAEPAATGIPAELS